MKYIYRTSKRAFYRIFIEAYESHMKIEQYVTENFGIRGECARVEVIG